MKKKQKNKNEKRELGIAGEDFQQREGEFSKSDLSKDVQEN